MIPTGTVLELINFLATTVHCQQHDDVTHLINRVTDFYRFDHHIYLIDSPVDLNRLFPLHHCENIIPQTLLTFDGLSDSDGNLTVEHAALKAIGSKNKFLVVIVENLQVQNGLNLLARVRAIRMLDYNMKVGVFATSSVASLDIVEQLFRWSWNASIVHIFTAFYLPVEAVAEPLFNIFTYDPFGTIFLINVTGSETLRELFPNQIPNHHQHPIQVMEVREFSKYRTETKVLDNIVSALNASMSKTLVNYAEYAVEGKVIGDIMHREKTARFYQVELYPYRLVMLMMLVPHLSHILTYLPICEMQERGQSFYLTLSL